MPTAAALRLEIEHALELKFPAALTPAPRAMYEVAATGIRAVDELLHGGLPVGAISGRTGATSSGTDEPGAPVCGAADGGSKERAHGSTCSDAFDPESAAANGVRLKQLLWMRCGVSHLFRNETAKRMGQPADRWEARTEGVRKSWVSPAWARLEQGLRATDLLLQAGGFAAIVLDLGDTASEQASRIPLATWFRYRQAAERTQCFARRCRCARVCAVGGSGGAGVLGAERGAGGRDGAARL